MFESMRGKAQVAFEARISKADSMETLAKELEAGKIVSAPFCTMEKPGEACADAVKAKCSANVRGTRYGGNEPAHGSCIVCGKPASAIVYIARQY